MPPTALGLPGPVFYVFFSSCSRVYTCKKGILCVHLLYFSLFVSIRIPYTGKCKYIEQIESSSSYKGIIEIKSFSPI